MSKKRIPAKMKALGLGIGLVAGVGAGLALETSGSSSAASPAIEIAADTGTDTATDTGTDAGRETERLARLQAVLQPLVDDGTLTQDQADKVVEALVAAGPMGDGHGGPRDGMMMKGLETASGVIGISTADLAAALAGGQTLAEVAVANGATAQAVIDALVAEVEAHLAEEVASGEHTQAEADARLAAATTRITDAVNNGGPLGRPGHGGRHGHHGEMDDDMTSDGSVDPSGSIDGGPADTVTTVPGA